MAAQQDLFSSGGFDDDSSPFGRGGQQPSSQMLSSSQYAAAPAQQPAVTRPSLHTPSTVYSANPVAPPPPVQSSSAFASTRFSNLPPPLEVKNSHLLALDGPPMWQSDGMVLECNMCQKTFDWLNRRHHVSFIYTAKKHQKSKIEFSVSMVINYDRFHILTFYFLFCCNPS